MKLFLMIIMGVLLTVSLQAKPSQAIVVTTPSWSASSGQLQRYTLQNGQWVKVGTPIAVKVGRNGMGWGIGLHTTPKDSNPIKREGDGKAPAGIFSLKEAFGYFPFRSAYPYKVYKSTDHCVDDSASRYYNRIVDSTAVTVDYKSHENMRFAKDFYKYGIVVDHNPKGIKRGGSCIFLHIKNIPTAGCTVMTESQMTQIIKWLDPAKNPVLVQAPKDTIGKLFKF